MDRDKYFHPKICVDVVRWDYKKDLQPGEFSVVVAHPPHQLEGVVGLRVLEIIRYLQPDLWWVTSRVSKKLSGSEYSFIDCHCCQFEECGFQKTTRFYGS